MDYKVILAPQAIADLENAVRHIAKDNPQAAFRFGNLLLDRVTILKDFPELGPAYRKRPGVRRLSSRPYIILYRVNHEQRIVEVMRYWHAARGDVELGPPAA
jgi:toxin ParE1/3/4